MQRLADFLRARARETYPEPISPGHEAITNQVLPDLIKQLKEPGRWVLDVGCGQGVALEAFQRWGIKAVGTTLNEEDLIVLKTKGYDVQFAMQEDLPLIWTNCFDLVWARHVLEHSIAPLWALAEFKRVMRDDGKLYVEVPMPDTACRHTDNQNHYSVLTDRGWQCLLSKAGFHLESAMQFTLQTPAGPDIYMGYIARKTPAQ